MLGRCAWVVLLGAIVKCALRHLGATVDCSACTMSYADVIDNTPVEFQTQRVGDAFCVVVEVVRTLVACSSHNVKVVVLILYCVGQLVANEQVLSVLCADVDDEVAFKHLA